jgi:hypothetical protein
MKARTYLFLAGLGAGAFLYYSGQGQKLLAAANTRLDNRRQRRATRELSTMLDDVVHRDDIPETPMKHAFEEAVHERVPHK